MEENTTEAAKEISAGLQGFDFSKVALDDIVGYLTQFGKNIIVAVIVYLLGRFIIKYAVKAARSLTRRRKVDPSLTSFLHSLVTISLNLLLAIIIIGILGIDTSTFLALFASAGIAVGMALSGTLQNFAGGVLILILKPYRVGDYIEAKGFAGTVREIQIFNTVLTTSDNQTIIIPNGPLSTDSLKNSTKAQNRRVDIDVEVAYGTKPDEVRKILERVVEEDERIFKEPAGMAPASPMTGMGSSSIVFQLRVWCKSADYWNVRFALTEAVYEELTAAGIEIPYQQMDVHLK